MLQRQNAVDTNQEETINSQLMRKRSMFLDDYQNKHYFISKVASHKDMWVFKHKFSNKFFTMNATTEWIETNCELLTGTHDIIRRKLKRTSQA